MHKQWVFKTENTLTQRTELYQSYIQKSLQNTNRKPDNYVCVVLQQSPQLKQLHNGAPGPVLNPSLGPSSTQQSPPLPPPSPHRRPYKIIVTHRNCKISNLLQQVRTWLEVKPSESLFLFCEGKLLSAEWELEPIYETCRDGADGFLYVSVSATEFMG